MQPKYFPQMAVKYGGVLEAPPRLMPSGWAALLYFYGLRYVPVGAGSTPP